MPRYKQRRNAESLTKVKYLNKNILRPLLMDLSLYKCYWNIMTTVKVT
ncbi:unnamed protein product [Moneuplotes crassus]|uniref:Uncharacterized protein n=1 Tax=Euplotes crassus TaxID=5936 RepID=A0AAD1X6V4_EUPCR|nr:unnamed protein product [Moneuplotes crassus]